MAILVQSNKKPSVSFPTLTGSIVTFNSQYAGLPLKKCLVNIPVTQEGTGDPSPDNVRNFVGISSLDFTANSVVKTFTFGQTIYAGELDILTGIFTAEYNIITVNNFASNAWRALGLGFGISFRNLGVFEDYVSDYNSNTNAICNYLDKRNNYTWNLSDGEFNIADGWVAFRSDANFNDVSSAISYFQTLYNDGTPVQFIGKLATPEVINLGGTSLLTAKGENNFFSSVGQTTLQNISIRS